MKTWLPIAMPLVLLLPLGFSPAFAGCDITIKAENQSLKQIQVQLSYSEVRTKLGTWAGLMYGQRECSMWPGAPDEPWIFDAKSGYESITCELDFACNAKRRYKFRLFYSGHAIYDYYPSDDDFTTSTTIDLGSIGRHFRDYD